MKNFRMQIQYDGGRYKGWQRLGSGSDTIQGKIEGVLSQLAGENIEIIGSSRTDAGVHAFSQIANFVMYKELPAEEIMTYVNKYLPQDISIIEVAEVPSDFHARYYVKQKTYLYKIWNKEYPNPFMRKYSMHVGRRLDIDKMRKSSGYFIGSHDFTAFSNAKSKKKSMVREIYSINMEEKEGMLEIRFCGNGFLYNMVRKLVGTLIAVGLGEIDGESIPDIIASKDRSNVPYIADACGLYLESVEF